MKQHLISAFYALVWVLAISGVHTLVSDPVQVDKADVVAGCMPSDEGEKAILWLESEHGGLQLHCEKHQVLSYGMAQVPVSVN